MSRYSDEDLLEEIRRVSTLSDVNGAPSKRTFNDHSDISSNTVTRQFGSWNAAIKESDLDPHVQTKKIPRNELLAELRRLRDELDQIPTADQMDEHGAYAYITYYERFGSWANALEEVFDEIPDRKWEHVSNAELLTELRRLASTDGEPPTVTDVTECGAHAVTTYQDRFGSWREALDTAGFEPPPPQSVTTEELLAELRRLRDEFGEYPTTTTVREHGAYSLPTYYSRFESWDSVLNAAFETSPGDDDEELLDEICRVADSTDSDGAPTISEFNEHSDTSDSTIRRRFGSWNEAVTKAGFEPNQSGPGPRYSDDELAAELRRLRDTVGHPPTKSEMNEQGAYASATYKNRFGSWMNALTETFDDVTESNLHSFRAGSRGDGNKSPHISAEGLLADLQALADELGRSPTSTDMRERGSHSARTYMKRFGSWDNALEAADLGPPDRNAISDVELIADLYRLRDELGEKPTSTDVAREGAYGLATYQRRFGSWGEAAAAAFDSDTDA